MLAPDDRQEFAEACVRAMFGSGWEPSRMFVKVGT
jgi:hypothetical protein